MRTFHLQNAFNSTIELKSVTIHRGCLIVYEASCDFGYVMIVDCSTEKDLCWVDLREEGGIEDAEARAKVLIDAWHRDKEIFQKTKHLRDGYTYQISPEELKEECNRLIPVAGQIPMPLLNAA